MSTVGTRAPERAQGTPRDLSVTALILGFAAMMWFGWGEAQPPAGWGLPLTIGIFAAIAVEGFAIAGAVTGAVSAVPTTRASGSWSTSR